MIKDIKEMNLEELIDTYNYSLNIFGKNDIASKMILNEIKKHKDELDRITNNKVNTLNSAIGKFDTNDSIMITVSERADRYIAIQQAIKCDIQ